MSDASRTEPADDPLGALLRRLADARREYTDTGPDDTRALIAHEAEVMEVVASAIEDPSRWRDIVACYAPSWRWAELEPLWRALVDGQPATGPHIVTSDEGTSYCALAVDGQPAPDTDRQVAGYDGPTVSDLIRDNPELTEESARAIEAMYREVYDRLRAPDPTDGRALVDGQPAPTPDPAFCAKRDWQVHCPCWTKGTGPCCACSAGPATPGPTREQVEVILSRKWGGDGTTRVTEATDELLSLFGSACAPAATTEPVEAHARQRSAVTWSDCACGHPAFCHDLTSDDSPPGGWLDPIEPCEVDDCDCEAYRGATPADGSPEPPEAE